MVEIADANLCIFFKGRGISFIALNVQSDGGSTAACSAEAENYTRVVREDEADALWNRKQEQYIWKNKSV